MTRKAMDTSSSVSASLMDCTEEAVPALVLMALAALDKARDELVSLPEASHAAAA